jgi:hypothetical protein
MVLIDEWTKRSLPESLADETLSDSDQGDKDADGQNDDDRRVAPFIGIDEARNKQKEAERSNDPDQCSGSREGIEAYRSLPDDSWWQQLHDPDQRQPDHR